MKSVILSIALSCICMVGMSQSSLTHFQHLDICEAGSLLIDLDRTDTEVRYWNGPDLRIDTTIVFEEHLASALRKGIDEGLFDFWIDMEHESEAILVPGIRNTEEVSNGLDAPRLEYTIYLPKRVESVSWAVKLLTEELSN